MSVSSPVRGNLNGATLIAHICAVLDALIDDACRFWLE